MESVALCGIVWKVWNVVWKISTNFVSNLYRVLLYGVNNAQAMPREWPDTQNDRKQTCVDRK